MSDENVIKLERAIQNRCDHSSFKIDPTLASVECGNCGEKLNPMWALDRLAMRESRLKLRLQESRAILKKLEEKKRTRCEHCNRLTPVKFKKPTLEEIQGEEVE